MQGIDVIRQGRVFKQPIPRQVEGEKLMLRPDVAQAWVLLVQVKGQVDGMTSPNTILEGLWDPLQPQLNEGGVWMGYDRRHGDRIWAFLGQCHRTPHKGRQRLQEKTIRVEVYSPLRLYNLQP